LLSAGFAHHKCSAGGPEPSPQNGLMAIPWCDLETQCVQQRNEVRGFDEEGIHGPDSTKLASKQRPVSDGTQLSKTKRLSNC
jgi:hypothetical protein